MKLSHILQHDLRKRSTCAHFDKSVDDQKPNCELTIRLIIWEVSRFFCNLKRQKAVWPLPFSNCNSEKKVTNNIDQFAYYGLNKVSMSIALKENWCLSRRPYNHRLSSTKMVGKWFQEFQGPLIILIESSQKAFYFMYGRWQGGFFRKSHLMHYWKNFV